MLNPEGAAGLIQENQEFIIGILNRKFPLKKQYISIENIIKIKQFYDLPAVSF